MLGSLPSRHCAWFLLSAGDCVLVAVRRSRGPINDHGNVPPDIVPWGKTARTSLASRCLFGTWSMPQAGEAHCDPSLARGGAAVEAQHDDPGLHDLRRPGEVREARRHRYLL